jgi:hypothetical protein
MKNLFNKINTLLKDSKIQKVFIKHESTGFVLNLNTKKPKRIYSLFIKNISYLNRKFYYFNLHIIYIKNNIKNIITLDFECFDSIIIDAINIYNSCNSCTFRSNFYMNYSSIQDLHFNQYYFDNFIPINKIDKTLNNLIFI